HVRPDLDLDRSAGREAGDADRAPRRTVISERLRIDIVDLRHVPDGGREDGDLGDVRERGSAVGEDRGDVGQGLPGLVPHALRDRPGGGMEAVRPGEPEPVAGAYRR